MQAETHNDHETNVKPQMKKNNRHTPAFKASKHHINNKDTSDVIREKSEYINSSVQ